MDKIIAFIMTHHDVTLEIKKDPNFYESICITMRKNKAIYREIIGENRLVGLESILAYMYDVVSSKEKEAEWIDKGDYAEFSNCGMNSGTQFNGVEPVPPDYLIDHIEVIEMDKEEN